MGTAKKHPVPDRVKPTFGSGQRSECPDVKNYNDGLTRSDTRCFIAVHIWQQWASNCEFCYKPALSTWSVELHSAAFILGWNVMLSLYLQHFCHLQRNLAVQILRIKVLVGSLDLHQVEGWWAAFTGVETRLWPIVDHLDQPDLPRHGCNSDRGPAASGEPTVLANDRNGGRLRLNASRHDDDDDWW